MPAALAPGWYPDPFARRELRFHDGAGWTEHVSDRGVAGIDTAPIELRNGRTRPARRVTAGPPQLGDGPRVLNSEPGAAGLLEADVLLVDGPGRVRSDPLGEDFHLRDSTGATLGILRVRREPALRRALRFLVADPHVAARRVQVLDAAGVTQLDLSRARGLHPSVDVRDGNRSPLGRLVPKRTVSGLEITLVAGAETVGTLWAWTPTSPDVIVSDPAGTEVLRVSVGWQVLAGSNHPEPDVRVVRVRPGTTGPLRTLAVAATLAVDHLLRALPVAAEPAAPLPLAPR